MALPVIFSQRCNLNIFSGPWRLNEFAIAQIHANMVSSAAVVNAEEHQIAFLQRFAVDLSGITQMKHLVGGARNLILNQIFIGIPYQAATVEAGVR